MNLEQMIIEKLPELSPGQKKVAEYILSNMEVFSYATLSRLSKDIAVSETTIIRLAYSLGLNSFSEMQDIVRKQLLGDIGRNSSDPEAGNSFYRQSILDELDLVQKWLERLDDAQMDQVVEMILSAEKILVVGARFSYSAARWLGDRLNQYLGNTSVVPEFYDNQFHIMGSQPEKTLVLCISYARYTRWTIQYVKAARSRGMKVVTFTDKYSSPLHELSDQTVIAAASKDATGANTPVCMYCLFSALLNRIREQNEEVIGKRLRMFDEIAGVFDLFDE